MREYIKFYKKEDYILELRLNAPKMESVACQTTNDLGKRSTTPQRGWNAKKSHDNAGHGKTRNIGIQVRLGNSANPIDSIDFQYLNQKPAGADPRDLQFLEKMRKSASNLRLSDNMPPVYTRLYVDG